MKKIISFILAMLLTVGLFANPLEKVTVGEWTFVSEDGPVSTWVKDDVTMKLVCDMKQHYVSLKDSELFIVYEGEFVDVKRANFELLHNRLPEVEWKECKNGKLTGRKLVKKTIAKADAIDSADGKREGVSTASSRASEAKEDFVWEE